MSATTSTPKKHSLGEDGVKPRAQPSTQKPDPSNGNNKNLRVIIHDNNDFIHFGFYGRRVPGYYGDLVPHKEDSAVSFANKLKGTVSTIQSDVQCGASLDLVRYISEGFETIRSLAHERTGRKDSDFSQDGQRYKIYAFLVRELEDAGKACGELLRATGMIKKSEIEQRKDTSLVKLPENHPADQTPHKEPPNLANAEEGNSLQKSNINAKGRRVAGVQLIDMFTEIQDFIGDGEEGKGGIYDKDKAIKFAEDLKNQVAAIKTAVSRGAKRELVKSMRRQFGKIEIKARSMSEKYRAEKKDKERRIYDTLKEQARGARVACEAMIDTCEITPALGLSVMAASLSQPAPYGEHVQ